ncbi:MAG: hypothetical protein IMZ54_02305, partial [Acidobacteria bacterium]|nr:hypothetical protein [Acidobacteriota bacterium]
MRKTPAILKLVVLAALLAAAAFAQTADPAKNAAKPPTTREMNLMCWQEFGELVPARIRTVLV